PSSPLTALLDSMGYAEAFLVKNTPSQIAPCPQPIQRTRNTATTLPVATSSTPG
ncbi:hypothetical protein BG015_005943, partial [Linnemannia schmuckeri]